MLLVAAASTCTLSAVRLAVAGQAETRPKIWEGVYTASQATRGRTAFESTCVLCDKVDLSGGQGPPLKGEAFMANWEGESLNRLFVKVRDTMPPDFGLLEPQTKIDIVAYLVQSNGFPPGQVELDQNPETLEDIQIVKKGASVGVANFSLVRVVGCLTQGTSKTWVLSFSSEPVVTREDSPTEMVLKEAALIPLATETFLLLNASRFQPESYVGHKFEARGLLYRAQGNNRITLTSLRAVSPACVP